MIEMNQTDAKLAENLYNEVKKIILSQQNNPSFHYEKYQHSLMEEQQFPGISKEYYNETGSVEYENVNGDIIMLEINRHHKSKHNGCSGLNGTPSLSAVVSKKRAIEKEKIWELKVDSGTLYYKATVTSDKLPIDILEAKKNNLVEQMESKANVKPFSPKKVWLSDNMLEEYQENIKIAKQGKEVLLKQKEEEIQEAINQINDFYAQKLKEYDETIKNTQQKMDDYTNVVATYSNFDSNLLGRALAQLMSMLECQNYTYREVMHTTTKRVAGVNDSWDEEQENKMKIILPSEKYADPSLLENDIDWIVANAPAIVLSEEEAYLSKPKTAVYQVKNGRIHCLMKFGNIDYVRGFVNAIIRYRFQNGLENFTEQDMTTCILNFLEANQERLIQNFSNQIMKRNLNIEKMN